MDKQQFNQDENFFDIYMETKVAGSFSLDKNGLKINQQKFCFKDKFGLLCAGKFVSDDELWNFLEIYGEKLK